MTKESLANAVIEQLTSNRFVEMKASNTKTEKQTISINFFGKLGVRVGLTKASAYIELPNKVFWDGIASYGLPYKAGMGDYTQFTINSEDQIALFNAVINDAWYQNGRSSAETFGCCNDFNACSDAKQCIHEDEQFYWGCTYRTNLEAGRIFYGKNRNVQEAQA